MDAATWGPYARLVDHTQQSDAGYRVNWHWAEPGRKLLEDWYDPYTGELSYTTTIVPGTQRGQLVLDSPKFGHKQWLGTVAPDGSVLYIGVGMMKAPYRVQLDNDGRMAMAFVRIKGDEVTENFITQYDHADAKGLIPRPVAPAADPKTWGVYARLLGARLAGKASTGISWRWMGDNVMLQDRGFLYPKMQIDLDGGNGLRMISGRPGEVWTGRVAPDGSVVWTDRKHDSLRMRIDGVDAVIDRVTLQDGVVVKSGSEERFRGHIGAAPL
ncbi:hypothetical protein [Cognatilysobacter lacus]|uniref:Uncharacterized protein n=1 Tax=Cognatilysobacter lacus TaxID=1643323 RepID=A0A5D8Z624_9GAMM|nr:hypothetical protein [Lysobacter lacus]TZF90211.1 hypothetical protein FW784_06270 [Lysobacter lacus]